MPITRREFVTTALVAAGSTAMGSLQGAESGQRVGKQDLPLFVSTWGFGKKANEKGRAVIREGGSTLDAVERGIRLVESAGVDSVGLSGRPNADGVVQLDACIMWGPGHKAGSVAALEGIVHPITAARRVMEKTRHVMLVGEGARKFALAEGLESAEAGGGGSRGEEEPETHDTIALLALGSDGNIAGGCSTSGWANKMPGRVGDSPIIGSGLYVDNEVGAAGATGVGENVMRYCACFMVVEYMRGGLDPEQACVKTIERIASTDPLGIRLGINFVALDKEGRYGAAGIRNGFSYAVTSAGDSRVLRSAAVREAPKR